MYWVRGVLLSFVLLLGVSGTFSGVSMAQESDLADHPIVGSWLLDADSEDPANPPSLVIFSSDGTFIESDSDGSVGIGAWESTGENTGILTLRFVDEGGMGIIRASFVVAEDGNTLTAEYTIEFVDPEGESAGEYGPATATATRAEVEAPGEPVGSLEDLFAEWEATPEATPEG